MNRPYWLKHKPTTQQILKKWDRFNFDLYLKICKHRNLTE